MTERTPLLPKTQPVLKIRTLNHRKVFLIRSAGARAAPNALEARNKW